MSDVNDELSTEEQIPAEIAALWPRLMEALKTVILSNPEFALESSRDRRKQRMIVDVAFLLSYDFDSDEDRQETITDIKRDYPWFNLVQNLDDLRSIKTLTEEDVSIVARMLPQLLKPKKENQ